MSEITEIKKIKLSLFKNKRVKFTLSALVALFFLFYIFNLTLAPNTKNYSETNNKIITVKKGESIKGTSIILKENEIIKSKNIFNILMTFHEKKVIEGDYVFDKPENIFSVISRLNNGDYRIPTIRITFFEGITVKQISEEIVKKIPNFNKDLFLEITAEKEGFLFPDTYNFRENVTPENIIKTLSENFDKKIKENFDKIESSKYSLEEIIIMASIVEKEATEDTFQEIANILWKRFEIGMPLQVDAPFLYYIGKGTFDLTMSDLQENHPYNTYRNVGLTKTPIGNPGLAAILAAANPKPTKKLYFLTGRDGKMYYASDLDGHRQNRFLYLD